MSWRLATVADDLVDQLAVEPEPRLRRVAESVAMAALEAAPVEDPRLDGALDALRTGSFADPAVRQTLKALADELDQSAWDLQERVDSGLAGQEEYLARFRQARAATALWFALDADAMTAAMEATYEARAVVEDGAVRRQVTGAS